MRRVGFVIFVLIFGVFSAIYFTNFRVKHDPASGRYLAAQEQEAQPLLEALEKYRADHGQYPSTLDQMTPTYLASGWNADRFLYTARRADWTLKSTECALREKDLHGWIMKEATEYAKEVGQFKLECISAYRDFQLQSPDFPGNAQFPTMERWAYYDSFTKNWSIGWCRHDRSTERGQDSAMNGICRQRVDGQAPDPW